MALNTTGPISIGGTTVGQSVNLELKLAATATSSLGDTAFRGLAKVPSGEISLNNFYGKSSIIDIAITTNTANYTLNPAAVPGYVAGETAVMLTIESGRYLYSTNTANAGLTISGFVTGDTITVVNNGYIMGMGGRGGSAPAGQGNGTAGGAAISISGINISVQNNSYIAGGGGGGARGIGGSLESGGGGGAGGGLGGSGNNGAVISPGGAGGNPGLSGANAVTSSGYYATSGGGGGGRSLPGVGGAGGTFSTNSATGGRGGSAGGGSGAMYDGDSSSGFNGVAGGSSNNPGTAGRAAGFIGGGGGGWGAAGGSVSGGYVGGAGGKAIALNGRIATVTGSGIVYGVIG